MQLTKFSLNEELNSFIFQWQRGEINKVMGHSCKLRRLPKIDGA